MRTRWRTETSSCVAPHAGGLNSPGAEWCGQCLRRFARPSAPPPAALHPSTPEPVGVSSPDTPDAAVAVASPRVFVARDGVVLWTCAVCGNANPLEAASCSVCGSSFARTVSPPVARRDDRDPNSAALYSLMLPGAGHAYVGLWGQAVARALMCSWVVTVALFAVGHGSGVGSVVLAASFGTAALTLWIVSVHDAYWAAKKDDGRALLYGRRWLYLTIALIAVLIVVLIVGMFGARSGAARA
jgi:hypothetical protein